MNGKIYVIKNLINNKVYIGQTVQDVYVRFKQHLKLLKSCNKQAIYKVIKSLEKNNFFVETLEEGIDSYQKLNSREEYYIRIFNSLAPDGYNLCPGGQKWRRKSNVNEQKIISLYREGKSARNIAEIEKISFSTILNCLKRNNIPRRNKACNLPDRTSKLKKDYLEQLMNQGLNNVEISKIVKLDESTIRRAIRRFNLSKI